MPQHLYSDPRNASDADECKGQVFRMKLHAPIIPHAR
jgi:hypothetical protein